MEPFRIVQPSQNLVPIIISVPHCGTDFPDELKDQYDQDLIKSPSDTDWFVDQLYDFAPSMGMTMITAKYSRWVIDLNRDPESKPLYNDGRIITALCPTTDFIGQPLYKDARKEVEASEIDRRLNKYYWPYHRKIEERLNALKQKFGSVLLWDCHSIKQMVPTIQKLKFPDLILGDADERSASRQLIDIALKNLGGQKYTLNHNHPFKGGFITRNFGKPSINQHALQLEMTKVNYMDDAEVNYDKNRADQMRVLLRTTLHELSEKLIQHHATPK
jgi:N-formylglutamate deformylase